MNLAAATHLARRPGGRGTFGIDFLLAIPEVAGFDYHPETSTIELLDRAGDVAAAAQLPRPTPEQPSSPRGATVAPPTSQLPTAAPPRLGEARFVQIAFVLGDGSLTHAHRVQVGEVLRLRDPEGTARYLIENGWIGLEVTDL